MKNHILYFRHLKWWIRRLSLKHLWYRARLPFRRMRWQRENANAMQPFQKTPAVFGAEPVLIIGHLSGGYGLSRGAAYDAVAISAQHNNVTVIDTGEPFSPDFNSPSIDVDRSIKYGTVYILGQPDTYKYILPLFDPSQLVNAYRIGRWVWETPIFPTAWRFALEVVHEIWTPSQFCAQAFSSTDLPVKVYEHQVLVEDKEDSIKSPHDRAYFGLPKDAFVGLAIMDIQSCPQRKNPWAHVLAWQTAFGQDASAILVMKVRAGKRTRIVIDELREMAAGAKNIIFIDRDLSSIEMSALQEVADVYISLHRSEGFGLNILECLLRNKTVLATHWSANAEYGPRFQSYIGVAFKLTPYCDWMQHYEEGNFNWADADVDDAAMKLRHVRDSLLLSVNDT